MRKLITAGIAALASLAVLTGTALAATVTSTPSSPAGWLAPGADGVNPPRYSTEQPRSGFGSLKFNSATDTAVTAYERTVSNVTLADVSEVSYDWYRVPGSAFTSAAVAFYLDTDIPCVDETYGTAALYNEPIYQRPGSPSLTAGQWFPTANQAGSAKWWFSCDVAKFDVEGEVGGNYTITFDEIQAAYPTNRVAAYGVSQENQGVVAYADNISLNFNVTNFETDPTRGALSATLSQPACGVVDVRERNARTSTNTAPARFDVYVSGALARRNTLAAGTALSVRVGPFGEDSRGGTAVVTVKATDRFGAVTLASRSFTTNCR